MRSGILNDAIKWATDRGTALRHEVACVLLNYTRSKPGGGLIGRRLTHDEASALAADLSCHFASIVNATSRVVRMDDVRAERDAAVMRIFNGSNHSSVMQEFGISRRLLYSILARNRANTKLVSYQRAPRLEPNGIA